MSSVRGWLQDRGEAIDIHNFEQIYFILAISIIKLLKAHVCTVQKYYLHELCIVENSHSILISLTTGLWMSLEIKKTVATKDHFS